MELEHRGVSVVDPKTGKIKSSLRTAVWTLVNEKVAIRGPQDATVLAAAHFDDIDLDTMEGRLSLLNSISDMREVG